MTDTHYSSNEWHRLLAELARSVGSEEFAAMLSKAYQLVSRYDSTYIVAFIDKKKPLELYSNVKNELRDITSIPYLRGAYLLDPFYGLFCDGVRKGQFRLKDLAPDGFFDSEYYHTFYSATGLVDETAIFVPISENVSVMISLGAHRWSASIRPDHAQLSVVNPLLVELGILHWQGGELAAGQPAVTMGKPLDAAFNNFGRDHLSKRECEVIRLVLKGYSSKGIARLLDISPETVKVYRKRVHTKLGIGSQAELFSLFLEAISLVPLDSDEDPLSFYLVPADA